MTTKQICDCISFMAMSITDKEHSLEYKQESLHTKYSQGFMPKEVYEHMSAVLNSCLREE